MTMVDIVRPGPLARKGLSGQAWQSRVVLRHPYDTLPPFPGGPRRQEAPMLGRGLCVGLLCAAAVLAAPVVAAAQDGGAGEAG